MGTGTRLIMIWGGLIALYLVLARSSGASTVLNSLKGFSTGITSTLQGR